MRRLRLGYWPALALAVMLSGSRGALADDAAERATLKGLGEVRLAVSGLSREAEAAGLKQQDLQTAIEARLKAAGVKLLAPTERARGMPTLFLNVSLAPADPEEDAGYVYSIELSLIQEVRLVRAQNIRVSAPTWKGAAAVGIIESDMLGPVRDMSLQAVDTFTAAYRAANAPGK